MKFRRASQILVFILFAILPWLALLNITGIYGSLYALEIFGIPFADPAQFALVLASGHIPGNLLILGTLLSLLIAFFLGRIFCSWICPYGFLSEMAVCWHKNKDAMPSKTSFKTNSLIKFSLFFLVVFISILSGISFVQFISFPGELSRLSLFVWQKEYAAIAICIFMPFILLLAEFFTKKRLWCKYLCPQSAFLGLISSFHNKKIFGLRINWNKNRCICKKNFACVQECDMNLDPRRKNAAHRGECTHCGKCVAICKKMGKALAWRMIPDNANDAKN